MEKKNYYAVKLGKNTGIFKTWSECKKQVNGFSGAIYKGFVTLNEAEEYLNLFSETKDEIKSKAEAIAYVDGSYDDSKKEFSYGIVMIYSGVTDFFLGKFDDKSLVDMRNVAGEISGAKETMKFCIQHGIKSLDIYYDYEGIEKWCTGEWKANKLGTIDYKNYFNSIKDKLKVNFIKVTAHTGNEYNEIADQLAKNALGLAPYPDLMIQNKNGMVVRNIKYDDFLKILELMKEDISTLKIEIFDIPYGKKFLIYADDLSESNLAVSFFEDKNKILVQGKKEKIFEVLSLYIVELLEKDEVNSFLNSIHDLNIDKSSVEVEFKKYLPNAYGKLSKKVDNYLHQAVYNLGIKEEMYDYTFLVEPAMRVLEAVLKLALLDHNIPIKKSFEKHDSFFVFEKNKKSYKLKDEFKKPEHSEKFKDYIAHTYAYFRNNRHTLSHWDNPCDPLDTTRTINSIKEVHSLIFDTLSIVDEYYTL